MVADAGDRLELDWLETAGSRCCQPFSYWLLKFKRSELRLSPIHTYGP